MFGRPVDRFPRALAASNFRHDAACGNCLSVFAGRAVVPHCFRGIFSLFPGTLYGWNL